MDQEARLRIVFNGDVSAYRAAQKAFNGYEHGSLTIPEIRDPASRVKLPIAAYLRRCIIGQLGLADWIETGFCTLRANDLSS